MNEIAQLLSVWTECTGQELNPRAMERIAYDFLHIGFTADDLRCVVKHMQRQNRAMGEERHNVPAHRPPAKDV